MTNDEARTRLERLYFWLLTEHPRLLDSLRKEGRSEEDVQYYREDELRDAEAIRVALEHLPN